jgi:hypothetical protein
MYLSEFASAPDYAGMPRNSLILPSFWNLWSATYSVIASSNASFVPVCVFVQWCCPSPEFVVEGTRSQSSGWIRERDLIIVGRIHLCWILWSHQSVLRGVDVSMPKTLKDIATYLESSWYQDHGWTVWIHRVVAAMWGTGNPLYACSPCHWLGS